MSGQKGRDLLLRIDNGTGTLVTVAGLRTRQIAFNAQIVDITHAESTGRWRLYRDVYVDGQIASGSISLNGSDVGAALSSLASQVTAMEARVP